MKAKSHRVIDDSEVGVYHIWSKTVQGAYLTGIDRQRLLNYTYRGLLVQARLDALAKVFAIECRDYEIQPQMLRLILCNRPDLVATWTDEELAYRWLPLNSHRLQLEGRPTPHRFQRFMKSNVEKRKARERISSIRWFMSALKQPLAQFMNEEDGTVGFFFNPRFGRERLPDHAQLLAELEPQWIPSYIRATTNRPTPPSAAPDEEVVSIKGNFGGARRRY